MKEGIVKTRLECLIYLLVSWLVVFIGNLLADEAIQITIEKIGTAEKVPIAITGLPGELEAILRFDLEVVGFEVVDKAHAQWVVQAKAGERLDGWLIDAITGQVVFSKAYTGGSARVRVHALADDIVESVLRIPGIARSKIAFRSTQDGTSEIVVSDYDGYNPIQVTHDRSIAAAPCWVPGALRLYYVTYAFGNADIVLHDLKTGERRFVARYSGSNISPAVSPDGKRIAMILSKGGSPDLYVANWDGTDLRRLTSSPEIEACPTWSPDGKKICFVTTLRGRRILALINADGGEVIPLRIEGVINPTEPDWSPDGRWIAFTSQMGTFQVCIVPSTGGEAKVLVAGEDPVWAANSRTLLFVRRVGGSRRLSLLDVFTKQLKDLHSELGDCSQPAWAR